MKLRALDLFCCAGGATRGLQQAGYEVTGVDIKPQPRYVGDRFIQADAMEIDWTGYDLIWASPPCQLYSELTPMTHKFAHPDLLPEVGERLRRQTIPYIIENVECARHLLRAPIMLCGTMFALGVWRHRYFEIGNADVFFLRPPCCHNFRPVHVSGRNKGSTADRGHVAMGIDWMVRDELTEAIPPAYSRFLAKQILERTYDPT